MNHLHCLLILLVGSLGACNSTRISAPNSVQSSLEERLQFLAVCLNNRDAPCLEKIYATDFSSISPIMTISSTKELVATTIANYTKNRLSVQLKVEDIKNGGDQGYTLVDWTMLQISAQNKKEVFLQQKRLDIWRRHETHGWQLYRTLFYTPVVR